MSLILANVKCNGSRNPVEGLRVCGSSKPGRTGCDCPGVVGGDACFGELLERAFPCPGMLLTPPGVVYPVALAGNVRHRKWMSKKVVR